MGAEALDDVVSRRDGFIRAPIRPELDYANFKDHIWITIGLEGVMMQRTSENNCRRCAKVQILIAQWTTAGGPS